jgi:hypothetical protein
MSVCSRKLDTKRLTFPRTVEQAEFHFLRVFCVEREVDALAVPGCSQGIRTARPNDGLSMDIYLAFLRRTPY